MERSAVSGKTSYLVAGFEMEDGRPIQEGSKYKKASDLGVKIISEDDVIKMIRESDPESSAKFEEEQKRKHEEEEAEMVRKAKQREEELLAASNAASSRSSSSSSSSSSEGKEHVQVKKSTAVPDLTLLTSKYAPKTMEDIIGNRRTIQLLQTWLQQWEDVHIHSMLNEPFE